MDLKKLDLKLTIIIFLTLSFLTWIGIYYVDLKEFDAKMNEIKSNELNALNTFEKIILDEYSRIISDLELLTYDIEIDLRDGYNSQVNQHMKAFSNVKKVYDQVRLLNTDGVEVIRVNFDSKESYIVADDQLQNKSNRDYFINAREIPGSGVYISELNLNIENGTIEIPHKPVIRFVKKMDNGSGYVILNYLAEKLLLQLESYVDNQDREVYLVNPNGTFISLNDAGVQFQFLENKELFSDYFPELWENRSDNDSVSINKDLFFGKELSIDKIRSINGEVIHNLGDIWLFSILKEDTSQLDHSFLSNNNLNQRIFSENTWLFIFYLIMALIIGYSKGKRDYESEFVNRALKFTAQVDIDFNEVDFLMLLSEYLANEFNTKYVIIDRIDEIDNPIASTVALFSNGNIEKNIQYPLKDTPCDNVFNKTLCCYNSNIQGLFPRDTMLAEMNAESYIGIPLYTTTGDPIGLIAMIDDKPFDSTKIMILVLQIVAVRAAQELEKQIHEERLKKALSLTENIIGVTEEAIIVYDENLKYLVWNDAAVDFVGVSENDVLGKKVLDVFPELEGEELYEIITNATKGVSNLNNEYRFTNKDGKEYWFRDHTKPLMINGSPNGAVKTLVNISDFKEKELILQDALDKAKLANESKSRFLSNMSHEIRTPMNGLLGLIDLTLLSDLTNEQREQLEIAQKSGKLLVALLNDILEYSRLESEKLIMEPEFVDLRDLVERLISLYKPLADSKGVKIRSEIDESLSTYVYIDSKRLTQVGANILGNAIKFTELGEVVLRIEVLEKNMQSIHLKFSCDDTGIGISKENLKIIFNRFTQADDSYVRIKGGSGLGLSISQKIIESMNSRIECKSEVGVGSSFSFDLNLKHRNFVGQGSLENSFEYVNAFESKSYKILIVDDDIVSGNLLKAFFSKEKHDCKYADNGLDAIEVFKNFSPDIIFMDISMPVMDGIETMRRIRSLNDGDNVFIVAQTAFALKQEEELFYDKGFNGYVSKPIDLADIRNKMKGWLENV